MRAGTAAANERYAFSVQLATNLHVVLARKLNDDNTA